MFTYPVPTTKKTQAFSIIKTSQSLLCRKIVPVCCEKYKKHINTLCMGKTGFIMLQYVAFGNN